ncbi:hypothetical protein RLF33_01335, partial [Streptococcus pneumoniae]|nr:hypothetical protein [Streptococcus pneumoniae]
MKKTFYRKFGISIIASTLLASQLPTVSALTVISSTGEEYEVSETLQEDPGTNNFSLPDVSPTYGQYYTNQSEVIIGKNDLVKVKNTLQYPYPQLFTPNLKTIQNPCLSLDPGWFLFSPNGCFLLDK